MTPRKRLVLAGMVALALGAAWWLSWPVAGGRPVALDGKSVKTRPDEESVSLAATQGKSRAARELESEDRAASASPAARRGPKGRVVSLNSRAGVGGVRVRLFHGGKPIEHAITGLDGTFAFRRPGATGDWVEAGPDSRFHFEPARRAISRAEEGRGSVELFLGVRRLPSGPATGLIVDERTGEPVPQYRLWIHDSVGTDDSMVSADDGRFRGDQDLVPGLRRIIGRDSTTYGGTAHEQRLEATDPSNPLRIEVPVGPTYSLLLSLPEGRRIEGFLAQLRRAEADAPASEQPTGVTRIRGGKPPWVRLSLESTPAGFKAEGSYELHLVSEDGLLSGRAAVASLIGIQSEPIAIELQPSGVLRGRVLGPEGEVPPNPRVTLEAAASSSRFEVVPSEGNFRIPGLDPGYYSLRVHGRGIRPYRKPVRIHAGEATVLVCRVERRPLDHRLAGVLCCRSGLPLAGLQVELVDSLGEAWPTELRWEEEAGLAYATFTADRLPGGDYSARVTWSRGLLTSTCTPDQAPAWLRGDAEESRLAIEVDDPPRGGPLRVRLQDASGLPLDGMIRVLGQGWSQETPCVRGLAVFESVPMEAETWAVLATNQQHGVAGAPGTLARQISSGEQEVSIVFSPGRQSALCVVGDDGNPRPGIRLLLDGKASAPSDGWGYVFHRGPLPPSRVASGDGDWTLSGSTHVDPATGRLLATPQDVVRVTVVPAQDQR